jgi:hypothetical protein
MTVPKLAWRTGNVPLFRKCKLKKRRPCLISLDSKLFITRSNNVPIRNTMACHGNAVVLLRVTRPTELRRHLLLLERRQPYEPRWLFRYSALEERSGLTCQCVDIQSCWAQSHSVCVSVPIYPLHGCPAAVAPTSAPLSHPYNKVLRSPQPYFRSLATVRVLLSLRDSLAADDRQLGCADSAEVYGHCMR